MTQTDEISLSIYDYWKYSPSREQYESEDIMQHATYNTVYFFSLFGICSVRWKEMVKENKLEEGSSKEF